MRNGGRIAATKRLARRLAELARQVRARVLASLSTTPREPGLRRLACAFQDYFPGGLTLEGFADLYAQFVTYALLTDRALHPAHVPREGQVSHIPVANPLLEELLISALDRGDETNGFAFGSLGIDELICFLQSADVESAMSGFDRQSFGGEPILDFYEAFLSEYDAGQRVVRGVYYTPRPVVSFTVNSIHEILQERFHLVDGLADVATWSETIQRHEGLRAPNGVPGKTAFVHILDPAAGAGAFLVEIIDRIHRTLTQKWAKHGYSEQDLARLWDQYVPEHLLPRVQGYELLPAAYAIAHINIGSKLRETGYHVRSSDRIRLICRNALATRPGGESHGSNGPDKCAPFTVIAGNPPYSGESANKIGWIRDAVKETYQKIEGKPIRERGKKNWLLDDYVKFLRWSHMALADGSNCGVVGMVTNNAYQDNPTFRGLRRSWLRDFDEISIVDLHGSAKRSDAGHASASDQNVFDIKQGVAVTFLVRETRRERLGDARVRRTDVWGSREAKYRKLQDSAISMMKTRPVTPGAGLWLFTGQNSAGCEEYLEWPKLTDIFVVNGNGIITAKDRFAYAFTDEELEQRLALFTDESVSDEEVKARLGIKGNSMWSVEEGRRRLRREMDQGRFIDVDYRPFDRRRTFYHRDVVFNLRLPVMRHMLGGGNISLLSTRMTKGDTFRHVFVTTGISDCAFLSSRTSTNAFSFPLFQREEKGAGESDVSRSNIDNRVIQSLENRLGLRWMESGVHGGVDAVTPQGFFAYIYAILHSNAYREKYGEFLGTDFPHIPMPSDTGLFVDLAQLGRSLIALHLLPPTTTDAWRSRERETRVDPLMSLKTSVQIDGEREIGKGFPRFEGNRVYINDSAWIDNVPAETWHSRLGGYQVCRKWLADRRGRALTDGDVLHYQEVIATLNRTRGIVASIDKAIAMRGDWPAAFERRGASGT